MIGRKILHYRIIEELGSGGVGIVYKAEDTKLGRTVAIKCLRDLLTVGHEQRKRFEQEARAAASLNHPGIATIYGFEEVDGQLFIVMELVDGQNLRRLIGNKPGRPYTPTLPLEKILYYTVKIAGGLKAAHEKGIVHRDIKPENIMINTRGEMKIMDFGLAKMTGSELLTKTETIVGTVAYMSPEQLTNSPVDLRTDIWSLGVMLFEMISGERPFSGDYEPAIIYSILNDNPKKLNSPFSNAPQMLEHIILKALAKNPADRYTSCENLINDLTICLKSTGSEVKVYQEAEFPEQQSGRNTSNAGASKISGYVRSVQNLLKNYRIITVVLVVLFLITVYIALHRSPPVNLSGKKIAVLPFININNDPADEYFSDGIMEDILTQLVKIGELKVISRTTMMTYKNSHKALGEISKELNADVVLEGSVRREAKQVRIAVQLIDANTDEHLWAETYDKELNQIFIIQSEIARKIAEAMHAKLSAAEQERLTASATSNWDAYNLILKGGYYLTRGSSDDVEKAIDQFKQAIFLDANNARAWAQLATAYARQADIGAVSTQEGYSNARQAAEKALELDDHLAQGHTIMGWIKRSYDWDWAGAEVECRKALDIAPGDVTVIRNMANMEKSLGRFDHAIILMQKASELDPHKIPIYTSLGFLSMYANRLEEAAAAYSKAIELNPDYPVSHTFLGLVFLLQGNPDQAIKEINQEKDEGWRLYGLAHAYYGANREADADTALQVLIKKYGDDSAYQVAQVYAQRGDVNRAFEWLEKAYLFRDGGLSELKGDPFMKKIESDPRYREFMKKMRLPL